MTSGEVFGWVGLYVRNNCQKLELVMTRTAPILERKPLLGFPFAS